jgi:hypothetical protein
MLIYKWCLGSCNASAKCKPNTWGVRPCSAGSAITTARASGAVRCCGPEESAGDAAARAGATVHARGGRRSGRERARAWNEGELERPGAPWRLEAHLRPAGWGRTGVRTTSVVDTRQPVGHDLNWLFEIVKHLAHSAATYATYPQQFTDLLKSSVYISN